MLHTYFYEKLVLAYWNVALQRSDEDHSKVWLAVRAAVGQNETQVFDFLLKFFVVPMEDWLAAWLSSFLPSILPSCLVSSLSFGLSWLVTAASNDFAENRSYLYQLGKFLLERTKFGDQCEVLCLTFRAFFRNKYLLTANCILLLL